MIHRAWVDESATLLFEDPEAWQQQLEGLRSKRVKVELKRAVVPRTVSQNSWYWGVLLKEAAEQTGNDVYDIHEALKEMHLPPEVKDVLGRKRATYTTTELGVEQMSEYLERCRATLAQFGVSVPEVE